MSSALIFYILGSIGAFLQHNLQYMDEKYKEYNMFFIVAFSIPISFCFFNAWTYIMNTTNSAWTAKFVFFGLSYSLFPFLSYIFLNETPFTLKNLICLMLSILIMIIQWKM